jgi:hypothetical protein
MKRCWRCKTSKAPDEFHRNKSERDGLSARCKTCVAADRKDHPERYRRYKHDTHLRNSYGVEPETYRAMLHAAGGQCQICGANSPGGGKRNFCVDHCHRTGVVRGLLCNRCNRAVGLLKDDAQVLANAITYLRSYAHQ